MNENGEIKNAMGIASPRGVDRPYIRGVQDAAVARGKIDPHLRISIPSTPRLGVGGSQGALVHFLLGNALGDQISDAWFPPFLVSDGESIN